MRTRFFLVSALTAFAIVSSSCAARRGSDDPTVPPPRIRTGVTQTHHISLIDDAIARELRLHFAHGRDGERLHPLAVEEIQRYAIDWTGAERRRSTEAILARRDRYRNVILRELQDADAPEDLLYIPFVESGYNPLARSRAGAVGMWQLMPQTARSLGLRIDDWVDERLDPVRSTRAAVRYLTDLYMQTGDWVLAIAAYNGGIDRLTRAVIANGTKDFFVLASREGTLPPETTAYVPRVVAAAMIGHEPESFGLYPPPIPVAPFTYDSVDVGPGILFSAISYVTGVPEEILRDLNPHLLREATPPSGDTYVRLPRTFMAYDAEMIRERLATIPPDRRFIGLPETRVIVETARPGDSLWRIAMRYGVSLESVQRANPGVSDLLHPGQQVRVERQVITYGGWTIEEIEDGRWLSGKPADSSTVAQRVHVVAPGERLVDIARRYEVPVGQIIRLNDLRNPDFIEIGRRLVIDPPPAMPAKSR